MLFKILSKSILSISTSTQPKKYLKYFSKYFLKKVLKIQVQSTSLKSILSTKYLIKIKFNNFYRCQNTVRILFAVCIIFERGSGAAVLHI